MSKATNGEPISQQQAEIKAKKTLAYEIGNLPRLSDPIKINSDYVFRLVIRLPRVVFDQDRDKPLKVNHMPPRQIGTICVLGQTGEVERTNLNTVNARIRRIKEETRTAVEKAVVLSSANRFSRLPFPTHRYTPVLDILSHLLVEDTIEPEELEEIDESLETGDADDKNYTDYINQLEEIDLVYTHQGQVQKGGVLSEIEAKARNEGLGEENNSSLPAQLNAALAHFFEEGTKNIGVIRQILGPYLVLSAFYYRRALEIGDEQPPDISEEEFKQELRDYYSGKGGAEKQFKASRYLIQLEDVGLLESHRKPDRVVWRGRSDIRDNLANQDDLINSMPQAVT